jgi:hypothetical protein
MMRSGSVSGTAMEEQGKKFLRYSVENKANGAAQIGCKPLPALAENGVYECTLTVRNVSLEAIRPAIREVAIPRRILWTVLAKPGREWETLTWYFELKTSTAPIGMWLQFYGSGQMDLGSLKLEKLTKEELAKRWKENHQGKASVANLFRNSRFPLGLPSGWSVRGSNSLGDDAKVESDPKTIGPTGTSALGIDSGRKSPHTPNRLRCSIRWPLTK